MWRFSILIAVLGLLLFAGDHAEAGDRRVALIIANSGYPGENALPNPEHDASLMKSALIAAGFFTVEVAPNLDYDAFIKALREFSGEARGAEAAFIYYAGHAIQSSGRNWLVPVDASLTEESELNLQAIDLDALLSAADGAKWRIVALDACRDNPFIARWHGRSRGYSVPGLNAVEADNILVIYAAAANRAALDGPPGKNSPFATALARRVAQPGLEIQRLGDQVRDDVLVATRDSQRPFVSASISNETFYFIPPTRNEPNQAMASNSTSGSEPYRMELEFWHSIEANGGTDGYKAYLAQYPTGQFAAIARQKLVSSVAPEARAALAAITERQWALDLTSDIFRAFIEKSSISDLKKLASTGDARAEFLFGYAVAEGDGGVDRDPGQALMWLHMAADQGEPAAQVAIGGLYQDGRGVPQDFAEAMHWYLMAAKEGYAVAQNNVGAAYLDGLGAQIDYMEAMRWFRKAADQGSALAKRNIGKLYQDGLGVPQDYAEAMRWYRDAAANGDHGASVSIGSLYAQGLGVTKDYLEALRWYQDAADKGNSIAQLKIGNLYYFGRGVPKDYLAAMRWYRRAADKGDAGAEYNVAMLYASGLSVKADVSMARHWMTLAAAQGQHDAIAWLSHHP
jgi:TPR repeat protein